MNLIKLTTPGGAVWINPSLVSCVMEDKRHKGCKVYYLDSEEQELEVDLSADSVAEAINIAKCSQLQSTRLG